VSNILSTITDDELTLIPTTSLQSLINTGAQQKEALNTKIAYKTRRKDRLAGTVSVYSPTGGRSAVKSFNSVQDEITAASKLSLPVASLSKSLDSLVGNGKDALVNDPLGNGASVNNDNARNLFTKLSQFNQELGDAQGTTTAQNSDRVVLLSAEIGGMKSDLASVNSLITRCNDVITRRAKGELLEPEVNTADLTNVAPELATAFQTYVEDNVVLPMQANFEVFNSFSMSLQGLDSSAPPPIFDLTYGPPISVKGQFVLSQDGLYYDSRGGGLPVVSGDILDASSWELEYAPNLGGKGIFYGDQRLEELKNTVFSKDFISDSKLVAKYYAADDILQNLERNKSRQISIVSGQINDLIVSGYGTNSAMVINYYSNIAAVASSYDSKIKKRRKQVQLVALFASGTYSFTEDDIEERPKNLGLGPGVLIGLNGVTMDSSGYWVPIERVPVNDFTFLKGKPITLTLEDQRDILLFSEDLDATILPIVPKFLVSAPQPFSVLDKFSISPTPMGEYPYIDGDKHVSSTGAFVLSLQDRIVTDSLICAYNFLKPDVVDASSNVFNLDNFKSDSAGLLNAQLVGSSVNHVFPSGLSIPFLRGTFYNEGPVGETGKKNILDTTGQGGSYIMLPTNKNPDGTVNTYAASTLSDLTYGIDPPDVTKDPQGGGFSFDFWVHVPTLNGPSMKDYHRYRVILANENSGGYLESPFILPDRLIIGKDLNVAGQLNKVTRTDRVQGLVIGFRDKGGPTDPSGIEFIISPTVSQNRKQSNNDIWGHSVCLVEDYGLTKGRTGVITTSSLTEMGITKAVSSTVSGVTLGDVSSTFMHMCLTFDYGSDKVRTIVDGEVWDESNMASSLMVGYAQSLQIPSFANKEGTLASQYFESFTADPVENGPSVNLDGDAFTPWVIGGGFTDGINNRGLDGEDGYVGFLGYNTNASYYNTYDPPGDTGSSQKSQHGRSIPLVSTRWQSGLNGYIGSFKVYGKALSSTEAKKNFDAQKGFFKNIVT